MTTPLDIWKESARLAALNIIIIWVLWYLSPPAGEGSFGAVMLLLVTWIIITVVMALYVVAKFNSYEMWREVEVYKDTISNKLKEPLREAEDIIKFGIESIDAVNAKNDQSNVTYESYRKLIKQVRVDLKHKLIIWTRR